MYYLIYGFLKLLSFIPLRILYLLSSSIAFLLYHVFKYRKAVVFKNLNIAFPEKTDKEITIIAKKFYVNFTDNFIEAIKAFSKGEKFFKKRVQLDISILTNILEQGRKIQIHAGHFFNWEYINLAMKPIHPHPLVAVYMPIGNKHLDKIFYDMRTRYGTIMLSAHTFKADYQKHNIDPHTFVLVADQNPGNPEYAYWTPFFERLTPFVTGPERGAIAKDAVVVYVQVTKPKRGYYNVTCKIITEQPTSLPTGGITKSFIAEMEANIRLQPEIYLWSHKRWKYDYKEAYSNLLV
jgi:Kdo2-lipid IVA lauroyltransferase/acyltransferase